MAQRTIKAGSLRHRVEVQALVDPLNTTREAVPEWRTEYARWGELRPLSSRELLQNDQIEARTTHEYETRYWDGLKFTHRIFYRDRVFHITGIRDIGERRRVYVISLVEVIDP